MSNLGLYRALDEADIRYEQTTVGDRFVYECMQQNGYCLGAEQSGHVILSKYATTGDGILTAIKIMEAMIGSKRSLSELAAPVKMFPQITENVRVKNKGAVRENERVQQALASVKTRLAGEGRILLRESGTEPVVRVMVEAATEALARAYAAEVAAVIRSEGLAT
jgi:phosphoglucosamine mutase